jgi:hypothetical protein
MEEASARSKNIGTCALALFKYRPDLPCATRQHAIMRTCKPNTTSRAAGVKASQLPKNHRRLFCMQPVLDCDLDLALPHALIDGLSVSISRSELLIWSSRVLALCIAPPDRPASKAPSACTSRIPATTTKSDTCDERASIYLYLP